MTQQLLWIEVLLKLTAGGLLVVAPSLVARTLVLPQSNTGFWPRLFGASLVGMALACYVEGAWTGSRGLGLTGAAAINLTVAAMLAAAVAGRSPASSWRGRMLLRLLVGLLLLLALLELVAR